MDHFARLPEGCISEILSHTSAKDASRSSVLSRAFKSASEPDHLWERFLPPDCHEILSRSSSVSCSPSTVLVKYATTTKDLYLSLCHSPVLIDGAKMSFSIDKRNGKKCFMVRARELMISWKGCWEFTSHSKSRFSEVAKLRSIGWIHIQGKIKTRMLSENTAYAVFLVFWLDRMDGLKSSYTKIRIVDGTQAENNRSSCNNHLESLETGKMAFKRPDGWMEIEMGKVYTNGCGGDDGEVEAWLIEINSRHSKSGLIVEGIEFRPVKIG